MTKYDDIRLSRCCGCSSSEVVTAYHRELRNFIRPRVELLALCADCNVIGTIEPPNYKIPLEEARLLAIKSRL